MRHLPKDEIEFHINQIKLSGFSIVKEYIPLDVVDYLLELVYEKEGKQKINYKGITSNQEKDRFIYHLQFKHIAFMNLLTDGNILDICKFFLNDEYYKELPEQDANFVLSQYNARSSVGKLPLHIDSNIPYISDKLLAMQVVFSLNGQTKSSGSTFILPGSHNLNRLPERTIDIENLQCLECDVGDTIIWDSRLWHGAFENSTKQERWSLVGTFKPWWLKQYFDPVFGTPEEIFEEMNEQQKALLGFLSLPPVDEEQKVVLKEGYDSLMQDINSYRQRFQKK
jgi:hypothetical protein